jgi:hypothetical protein
MHVHVHCPDGEAKFWLEPAIAMAHNYGLSDQQIRSPQQLACTMHEGTDFPIQKLLSGRDPVRGADLASRPTLSRFENSFARADLYRMSVGFADAVIERRRQRLKRKAKRITIDLREPVKSELPTEHRPPGLHHLFCEIDANSSDLRHESTVFGFRLNAYTQSWHSMPCGCTASETGDSFIFGSSDRGPRFRSAQEGIDDADKSALFARNALPRRSTSLVADFSDGTAGA